MQNRVKFLFLFFTILSIILILFNIYYPHEVFAMAPPQDTDDIIRSFNPDTYTRHELDGNPITKVDKPTYNEGKRRI
jgi:cellulose synthase/poly-beta-1,6-N-acetylglucosamine synthase-like glycosyltransferase